MTDWLTDWIDEWLIDWFVDTLVWRCQCMLHVTPTWLPRLSQKPDYFRASVTTVSIRKACKRNDISKIKKKTVSEFCLLKSVARAYQYMRLNISYLFAQIFRPSIFKIELNLTVIHEFNSIFIHHTANCWHHAFSTTIRHQVVNAQK